MTEPRSGDKLPDQGTEPDKAKSRSATFGITGMTCATCAGIVEEAINDLPGVGEATVNLATEKARVVYDPSLIDPSG